MGGKRKIPRQVWLSCEPEAGLPPRDRQGLVCWKLVKGSERVWVPPHPHLLLLWRGSSRRAPSTCDGPSGRLPAEGCSPAPVPAARSPAAPAAPPAPTPSGSAGFHTGPGSKASGWVREVIISSILFGLRRGWRM